LLCLDVDGTLETGSPPGPIKLGALKLLQEAGVRVVIVSPSPFAPEGFEKCIAGDTRLEHLKRADQGELLKVYISDNPGDDKVAEEAGYAFLYPKMERSFSND